MDLLWTNSKFRAKAPGLALALLAFIFVPTALAADAISSSDREFFEQKIRPVLVQNCYECHSADAEKIKGGLLLDTAEGLLKGGDTGPALVPGDPEKSKLIIAVRHTDKDLQMPPKRKLADGEIADLEQWVKMGAPDPRMAPPGYYKQAKEIWSAKPIGSPAPPIVKNKGWVRDPIDAFILAELEKRGMNPAPPANPSTLARRASFDLLGMPPNREDVEDFSDNSKFEALVDQYLESPHFGERWARHWLDLARYADSNGLDFNQPYPNAWRYRDWVVNAFNSDKPYDEFIREQIAGDLIEAKDNEDRHQKWIATGFLTLGPKNLGEPNPEKLLMDIADEQIDVTCRATLGLTVACARCHDHKFDPIPTKDYYAIAGIFRSTATLSTSRNRFPGDQSPFNERSLGTPEQDALVEKYNKELAEITAKIETARRLKRELPGGIDSKEMDGIVMDNLEAEVVGPWAVSNYSTNFVDKNYLHDGNERSGKGKKIVRFHPTLPQEGLYEVRLAYTARLNRATNVPVRVHAKGVTRTIYLNQRLEPKYDKAFETLGVFDLAEGTNTVVEVLTEGTKGFVVVDAVQFLPKDIQLAAKLMKKRPQVEEGGGMMMAEVTGAQLYDLQAKLGEITSTPPPSVPMAMAVRDGQPRNVKVHLRGDPDRLGEEAPRGVLTVLKPTAGDAEFNSKESGRLELANWIASDRNPLTARVMVNRVWLHLFGRGIVNTPDNFGSVGELPSHPELLDYLASEFMREGWSVKKLVRRIMLSSTYQMSSEFDAANFEKDPDNVFHWRMNRRRLDAEGLRDAVLAASESLDLQMGGSLLDSVTMGPPNRPGPRNPAADSTRRSIYLPVFRGAVLDLFNVFDFPDPHALSAKRYVTAAPTQALFLMNSPFILDQSKTWSGKLLARTDQSDSDRVETAWFHAFSRKPSASEKKLSLDFLNKFEANLAPVEADPNARKQKAWAAFCQSLFESAEFRFLD